MEVNIPGHVCLCTLSGPATGWFVKCSCIERRVDTPCSICTCSCYVASVSGRRVCLPSRRELYLL